MIIGLVLSNVLYLLVAVVVAIIGAMVVVLRHRKPKSVEANVASFNRGLRALAPDQPPDAPADRPTWGGARRPARPAGAVDGTGGPPGSPESGEETEPPDPEDALPGPQDQPPAPAATAAPTATPAGAEQASRDADDPAGGQAEGEETAKDDPSGIGEASVDDPATEPVHLTSRMRRPGSHAAQARRVDDQPRVPTEEAETG